MVGVSWARNGGFPRVSWGFRARAAKTLRGKVWRNTSVCMGGEGFPPSDLSPDIILKEAWPAAAPLALFYNFTPVYVLEFYRPTFPRSLIHSRSPCHARTRKLFSSYTRFNLSLKRHVDFAPL